jgi:hypothetical protein
LATSDQLGKDSDLKKQSKDKSENLFNIAEFIMFDKVQRGNFTALEHVRNLVNSLAGDTQLINDSLFENYPSATLYYDDSFNKTSYLTQCFSDADIREAFVGRTQDYSLKYMQFIPAAMFKLFCANMRGK